MEDVQLTQNINHKATRPQGQRRRQEIISTASKLLSQKGLRKFVMRDVCKHLGIHIGNLHYYFPTKNDLLLAIFGAESSAYSANLNKPSLRNLDRKDRLREIIELSLAEIRSPQAKLWCQLVALAQHDPKAANLLKQANEIYHKAFAIELRAFDEELTPARSLRIAQLIWTLLDGLAIHSNSNTINVKANKALRIEIKILIKALITMED